MARELFGVKQDGVAREWQGAHFERLAVLCEAAGLTMLEAAAVNNMSRNIPLAESGRLVGMEPAEGEARRDTRIRLRSAMWRNLHRAEEKLQAFIFSEARLQARERKAAELRRARPRSGSDHAALREIINLMREWTSKPRTPVFDTSGRQVCGSTLVIPSDLKADATIPGDWMADFCHLVQVKLEQDRESQDEGRAAWVSPLTRRRTRGQNKAA